MANIEDVVKNNILTYINNNGGIYPNWYVGIAQEPRKRLFVDHAVLEVGDAWIYDWCLTSDAARRVEDYFVNVLKTSGDTGGGDENTTAVYAYRKSSHSRE